jgi:hypothetical protein
MYEPGKTFHIDYTHAESTASTRNNAWMRTLQSGLSTASRQQKETDKTLFRAFRGS